MALPANLAACALLIGTVLAGPAKPAPKSIQEIAEPFLRAIKQPHLQPTTGHLHGLVAAVNKATPPPTVAPKVHPAPVVALKHKTEHKVVKRNATADAAYLNRVGKEMSPPMEAWEQLDEDVDPERDVKTWLAEERQEEARDKAEEKAAVHTSDVVDSEEVDSFRRMLNPARYANTPRVHHVHDDQPSAPHHEVAKVVKAVSSEDSHAHRGDPISSLHSKLGDRFGTTQSKAVVAAAHSTKATKKADPARLRLSKAMNSSDFTAAPIVVPDQVAVELANAVSALDGPKTDVPSQSAPSKPKRNQNATEDPMATLHARFHQPKAADAKKMIVKAPAEEKDTTPKLLKDVLNVREAVKKSEIAIPKDVATRLANAERDPEADTGLRRDLETAEERPQPAWHASQGDDPMVAIHRAAVKAKHAAEGEAKAKPAGTAPKLPTAKPAVHLNDALKVSEEDVAGLKDTIPPAVAQELMKAEAALNPEAAAEKKKAVAGTTGESGDVLGALHQRAHPTTTPKANSTQDVEAQHARRSHAADLKAATESLGADAKVTDPKLGKALEVAAAALAPPGDDAAAAPVAPADKANPKDEIAALYSKLHSKKSENKTVATPTVKAEKAPVASLPGLHRHKRPLSK